MIAHARRLLPALAATSTLMVAAWGCGGGAPPVTSDTTEATVKGTVTINGKPATKGKVVFDPANYRRKDANARPADIGKDGTYSVTTLVGGNTVRVEGPEAEKAGAAYMSIDFDVAAGDNTLNITLPR
jgi:hypothetical protein